MADCSGLHILIVPSWWPSPEQPINGVFHTDYARAFAAAGARVGAVVPDLVSPRYLRRGTSIPWLPRPSRETMDGIPVVRIRGLHAALRLPRLQMHRFRRWLHRAFGIYVERFGRPDLLHAMCALPAAWACTHLPDPLAARVVVTENTGPFSLIMTPSRGRGFVRSGLAKASRVVAVSAPLRDAMHAAGIDRPIEVVPNPVAAAFTGAAPPPVKTDPAGRPACRALFVGRLTKLKGIPELIDAALAIAHKGRFAIDWHVAGYGPLAGEMRRLDGARPACRLTMHGLCEKPRVAELLRESHFLVLPSHGENCPLAICEALSVGRPVVTTEAEGCRALVGAEDGVLARIDDARSLAAAIEKLLEDYPAWDWRSISDRARGRFSAEAVASAYGAIFRGALRA